MISTWRGGAARVQHWPQPCRRRRCQQPNFLKLATTSSGRAAGHGALLQPGALPADGVRLDGP